MRLSLSVYGFVILFCYSCTDQESSVDPGPLSEVTAAGFGIDLADKMLLYNGAAFNPAQQQLLIEDEVLLFPYDEELMLGLLYSVSWQSEAYQFFRTELPILVVQTRDAEIIGELYQSGTFDLIEDGQVTTTGNTGIRLRGNTSLGFPKKSYRMELWEDEEGVTNSSASLLGMREDDDWLLDGMWNEPLAIRDKSAMELWLSFGRVHYQQEEPNAQLGADRRYCELFINGSYKGLYYLGERLDRKQLKLEAYDGDPLIGGELYKAKEWVNAVGGFSLPQVDNSSTEWGNYEIKYPTDPGTFDWAKLRNFKDFFINGSDTEIIEQSAEKVDIDNLVDYFIFTNLIYGFDNQGNNVYIARRDQMSPYFFVSWDYDATLGIGINGEDIPSTAGVLLHVVTERLLLTDTFRNALKVRWQSLKNDRLRGDRIKAFYQDNYSLLRRNNIYEREAVFSRFERDFPGIMELETITRTLDERLLFLEEYIANL